MNAETASLVYPVLEHGLRVRSGLAQGRAFTFEREHARLKELLPTSAANLGSTGPSPSGRALPSDFLGVRYILACWVDELFITGTPWRDQWNERKLEVELFGSNDRAWKFWDQARLAEQMPSDDVLEVIFLCVQLGFRGTMLEDPVALKTWLTAARDRLRELPIEESPYELEPDPPFEAAPRHATHAYERMLAVVGIVALILVPCAAFVLISEAGGR